MMTDLYRRNGAAPAPLPSITYNDDGDAYTPPYADDDLARLGFVLAPSRPAETDAQTVAWDHDAEAWIMVDRPPALEPEVDPFAGFIPVPILRQRIEEIGMWEEFAAYLAQNPAEMLKVVTLERGVDPSYPAISAAFDAMDIPAEKRAIILAPV